MKKRRNGEKTQTREEKIKGSMKGDKCGHRYAEIEEEMEERDVEINK